MVRGLDHVGQTFAFEKVHHYIRLASGHNAAVVDRNDIGVLQVRSGLGFLLKALDTELIGDVLRLQHFDCHSAVHHLVHALVDDAHATTTDLHQDPVTIV